MKNHQARLAPIAGIVLLLAATGCQSDKNPSLSIIPRSSETESAFAPVETAPDLPPEPAQNERTRVKPQDTDPTLQPIPDIVGTDPYEDGTHPNIAPASDAGSRSSDQKLPSRIRFSDFWLDPDALKSDTVYFDFDRSDIRSDEIVKIEEVAVFLKTKTSNAILIDGHCDDRGTEEYNRALGERRALTIRETLVNMGVAPNRIHTRSLGEDRPAETGQNEFAWSRNRRGEFALLVPVQPDS
jgi:peptidoglycan-associated lipoprotein